MNENLVFGARVLGVVDISGMGGAFAADCGMSAGAVPEIDHDYQPQHHTRGVGSIIRVRTDEASISRKSTALMKDVRDLKDGGTPWLSAARMPALQDASLKAKKLFGPEAKVATGYRRT